MAYDLTGQRFGKLVAEASLGFLADGGNHRYWRCRCDCGNVEAIPQYKLTAPSQASQRAKLACSLCQRRRCVVCQAIIPLPPKPGGAPRLTCSDTCKAAHKRAMNRDFQRRKRQARPEYDAALRAAKREAMRVDPELLARVRHQWQAHNRRRRDRLTEEDRQRRSERNRRAYLRRRAQWLSLSLDERNRRLATLREHRAGRQEIIRQQRRRRRLLEPIDKRQRRLEADRSAQRERRRQRALLKLNATVAMLLDQQDRNT